MSRGRLLKYCFTVVHIHVVILTGLIYVPSYSASLIASKAVGITWFKETSRLISKLNIEGLCFTLPSIIIITMTMNGPWIKETNKMDLNLPITTHCLIDVTF